MYQQGDRAMRITSDLVVQATQVSKNPTMMPFGYEKSAPKVRMSAGIQYRFLFGRFEGRGYSKKPFGFNLCINAFVKDGIGQRSRRHHSLIVDWLI
jgi:hypothetical protein